MIRKFFLLIIIIAIISACNFKSKKKQQSTNSDSSQVESIVLNDSVRNHLIIEGSSISKQLATVLQKNLKIAVKKGDFDHAIDFCHNRAMILTDSVANALNVKIKRAAKKYRNISNETTNKESDLYKQFVIDWLSNKPLRPQIIPDSNGHPVFYSVIKLNNKVCLNCHGTPGKELPLDREKKIKKYYPNDIATNIKFGEPRGMWVITFPDYIITQEK